MRGHERAFRTIHNGVFVVTTKEGEKPNGMTAAWVTRVSFNPPLVAVSIGKTRHSHGMLERSGAFALNILSEGQVALGKHFGFKSGRKTDKLKGIEYTTAKTGSPILDGISGFLDCRVVGSCDAGDHTIFVGEVVDSGAYDRPPLLFRHEDFF